MVALATPPGRSALALRRLSGTGAFGVAARCLRPFLSQPPRTARRARLVHPGSGESLDEVLAACFPGPRSFTGDDLVEVTTHGGLLVPAACVAAFVVAGAPPAPPPGFARRAPLDSEPDLLPAPGAGRLIHAGLPPQPRPAPQPLPHAVLQRRPS